MSDLKIQGVVEMNAEGAERALDRVGDRAGRMAVNMQQAGEKAGKAVDQIGNLAKASGEKLTRSEGAMVASIKRLASEAAKAKDVVGGLGNIEFNIGARGLDRAKFAPMIDVIRSLSKEARLAADSTNSSFSSIGVASGGLSGQMSSLAKSTLAAGAAFASLASIKSIASAMITAQQSAQKLRNALEYAAGGASGAASEIAYLRDVTNRLGMDFETSSQAYAKFAAATKGSGVSLSQTKVVFEGLASASAKLGLSADETQGALLALSQMASKGVVSAEELRGQLGERLPGAFNIAAKSMGVTTSELGKMLETGQIMAADFLPKFGQALKDNFQAPLESLTQELNRFSSAWTVWKQELSEGANGSGFKWLTNGLNESTAAMRALGEEAGITQRLLVAVGGFEAGAVGANMYDTAKVQDQAMQALSAIKARIAALKEEKELSSNSNSGTRNRIDYQLNAALKEEIALREKIMSLAVRRGKETGIVLPDLAGEYAAQQKKQTDKLNAYLNDASNAPKAVKIAAEVEKENAAFKAAVAGMSETDAKYIAAAKSHNERVAEIQSKAKQSNAPYGGAFLRQEESARIAKELAGELNAIEKANADYAKSIERMYAPMEKEADALEAQLQNYGLSRAEIEANTLARLEEQRAILAGQSGFDSLIANLDREIDARKRIKEAAAGIDARKASDEWAKESAKSAKKAADDWEKTSEKIGDSITDALMRGFESGKGFAESMRDTIVNMFKTMVLRPAVQATVMGGLYAMGMGTAMASDGSSGGGIGGSGSWLSTANDAYNLYSGGYGGLYSGFANSSIGAGLGLSAGLSTTLGVAGGAGTVMGGSAALAAAEATTLSGASALTSMGSAIGAALPYVGLVAAAVSMLSGSLKGGTPHAGGIVLSDGSTTNSPANGTELKSYFATESDSYNLGENDWFKRADKTVADAITPAAERISQLLNLSSDAFGTGKDYTTGLAFSSDGEDKSRGRYSIIDDAGIEVFDWGRRKFSKDASEGIGEFLSATGEGVVSVLNKMELPEWAARMVGALGDKPTLDAVDQLVTTMSAIKSTAELLSPAFNMLENDFAELYTMVGADILNAYYQTVYSDAEKLQHATDQVSGAFEKLGFKMPATVAEFRSLVEAQDETTEAGRETVGSLMSLTSSFASVVSGSEQAASAIASTWNSIVQQLREEASGTQGIALDYAQDAVNAASSALDAARDAAERAIDSVYQSASSALEAQINNLDSIAGAVENALSGNLVENSLAGYRLAQQGLELALAQMRAGVSVDADSLSQMAGRATGLDSGWFATQSDMLRAQARTNATLSEIGGLAGSNKTAAESALESLTTQYNAQISALNGIDETVKTVEQAMRDYYAAQDDLNIAQFNLDQVELAGQQLDALNGINKGFSSLTEAMQGLNASIYALALSTSQSVTNPVGNYTGTNGASYDASSDMWSSGAGSADTTDIRDQLTKIFNEQGASETFDAAVSVGLSIQDIDRIGNLTAGTTYNAVSGDIKKSLLAAYASGGDLGVYNSAKSLGLSLSQVDKLAGFPTGTAEEWAKKAGLPTFASGTNFVPNDMLAGIHAGERIIPAADNRELMNRLSSNSNQDVITELRLLKAELMAIKSQTTATARNTYSQKQSLDRVVDGDALLTRAAA